MRINLISGPRNISTALMYSFRSRTDTTVVDEPLYGAYLAQTGVDHPGRAETLASMETDYDTVMTQMLGPWATDHVFFKNMGHHIVVFADWSWLEQVTNVFLTRRPVEVLASFAKNVPNPSLDLTGFEGQVHLLRYLRQRGFDPPVLDSAVVLQDPPGVLADLCERIGVSWDNSMLAWEPGPKPEDGSWGEHWYHRVWGSTGFEPYEPTEPELPEELAGLLAQCNELYAELVGPSDLS